MSRRSPRTSAARLTLGKQLLAVALAVTSAAVVAFVALCWSGGVRAPSSRGGLGALDRAALSSELLLLAREGGTPALRAWLLRLGPSASAEVLAALDNGGDRASSARVAALDAICSLGSEGLSETAVAAWAGQLRRLAGSMLHAGPERSDYVAKSYLMEGRAEAAAAEYRLVPESPPARVFFEQNPNLRAPASR